VIILLSTKWSTVVKNKVETTIENIKKYFLAGYIQVSAISGKDSFAVTHLAVQALKEAMEINPNVGPLYLMTTDTTIDNFEVHSYILSVHKAAVEYGIKMGLPIESRVVKPSLLTRPLISYIGRGKILHTPETTRTGRSCAIDWKIMPAQNFMKELREKHQTTKILGLSGSRDQESPIRAKNIAKRGESIDTIAVTDLGYTICPVKNWSLGEIWALANQIENGDVDSFAEDCVQGLFKNYSAGNGGTCDLYATNTKSLQSFCGARFGCFTCAMSKNDSSLQQQIISSPATYGYMTPLNEFRTFMMNTLNDLEYSRSMVGRDEKLGQYLKIGWNQYSIWYRQILLRIILTIDQKECDRAEQLGIEPKFQLIGHQELITIQYLWCKTGGETSVASAFAIWHEVKNEGKYFDIPKTTYAEASGSALSLSEARFLGGDKLAPYRYVKLSDFEDRLVALDIDRPGLSVTSKIRSSAISPRLIEDDGSFTSVIPFIESHRFEVTDEAAADTFVEDTYKDLVELALNSKDGFEYVDPTEFLKIMLDRGIVRIKKGQIKQLHKDAKRAQLINAVNRLGKNFEAVFLANSISEAKYKAELKKMSKPEDSLQMAMGF
jgi:DNA sulfur modification protein DndC